MDVYKDALPGYFGNLSPQQEASVAELKSRIKKFVSETPELVSL